MTKQVNYLCILLISLWVISSCKESAVYLPKPRSYPKIVFPKKTYQNFDEGYCPFSFEYPSYARVIQDTLFFNDKPAHPCWFDVYVEEFDARIHCSYYEINSRGDFEDYVNDAFDLAEEHDIRAEYRKEIPYQNDNGVGGFIFEMTGPAATPYQFFLTDTTRHFLRGALYIEARVETDSLAPILDFMQEDVDKMLESFSW